MKICKLYTISGRVQGVWYRASAQKAALKFGVTGHAKNIKSRQVQVLACGEEAALETFEQWLWKGPLFAKVTLVETKSIPLQSHETFEIL